MKVKQLRLIGGCHALKSGDNFMANEHIKIDMIGGGNFLVDFHGSLVFVPNAQVQFAVCEHDEKKKP